MKEDMETIFKINEKIKLVAEGLKLFFPAPPRAREELIKTIEETLILLRKNEKHMLPRLTPKEIYIVGKVFGRVEAIYSLIAKEIIDVREKE
jgi:hypothetical protein